MNFARRSLVLPGVTGTARVGVTAEVIARLRPGDIAVLDHVDLDRETALALVETGARMVVNAGPLLSGRYADVGPRVLAEADVLLVEGIGADAMADLPDGIRVRVHRGVVRTAPEPPDDSLDIIPGGVPEPPVEQVEQVLAVGREVDLATVLREMAQVRTSLVDQMEWLAKATGDFLHREQELLLDGHGLPDLTSDLRGRPVVVVARADHEELQSLRAFAREQSPVLIAVGSATDELLAEHWVPDVLVLSGDDPASVPSRDALRAASDVVLLADREPLPEVAEALGAAEVTPSLVDSSATAEDLALLLADRHGADIVVAVGLDARLEDFLGDQRSGPGSSFATRLRVGSRLVDAAAVRHLYGGRAQSLQLVLVVLAGLIALLAAISVTAVGQRWVASLVDLVQGLT